jgi:hypothetical protein
MRSILACWAALAALWTGPAGAPVFCPDESGEYSPEHCDLIEPIERHPRTVGCDILGLLAEEEAHPACIDYWAGVDPGMLLQVLHDRRRRESATAD